MSTAVRAPDTEHRCRRAPPAPDKTFRNTPTGDGAVYRTKLTGEYAHPTLNGIGRHLSLQAPKAFAGCPRRSLVLPPSVTAFAPHHLRSGHAAAQVRLLSESRTSGRTRSSHARRRTSTSLPELVRISETMSWREFDSSANRQELNRPSTTPSAASALNSRPMSGKSVTRSAQWRRHRLPSRRAVRRARIPLPRPDEEPTAATRFRFDFSVASKGVRHAAAPVVGAARARPRDPRSSRRTTRTWGSLVMERFGTATRRDQRVRACGGQCDAGKPRSGPAGVSAGSGQRLVMTLPRV